MVKSREKDLSAARDQISRVNLREIDDPVENVFIRGEMSLVRLFMLERETMRAEGGSSWRAYLAEARELVRIADSLPGRLQAEGHFHLGRALIHQPTDHETLEGRNQIDRAMRLARADGRRKIEAACHLALSESFIDEDPGRAHAHWQAAADLSRSIASGYIEEWVNRVAARVESGATLLNLEGTFEDVRKRFRQLYADYHLARANSDREAWKERTGLSLQTLHRYRSRKDA